MSLDKCTINGHKAAGSAHIDMGRELPGGLRGRKSWEAQVVAGQELKEEHPTEWVGQVVEFVGIFYTEKGSSPGSGKATVSNVTIREPGGDVDITLEGNGKPSLENKSLIDDY